jgi:hypothetical protein
MGLREIGRGVDQIDLAQDVNTWQGCGVHGNEPSVSYNAGNCLTGFSHRAMIHHIS